MLAALGTLFLLVGLFFCVMGVVGNVRLPDVFTRLHATSKVSSFGILGLVAGSALLVPESAPKAAVLGMLILFSAPVASQAIARTAYRDGCLVAGLVRDDLNPVEYIDFDVDYTVGDVAPEVAPDMPPEAVDGVPPVMPDVDSTLYGRDDEENLND